MRVFSAAIVACAFAWFTPVVAQQEQMPPECVYNGQAAPDWGACLRVSPPGSPWRGLPLINLGTDALQRGDYANAVRYYDEATPPGSTITSDVSFHAFRATAYWHVGRMPEALADAQLVYRMIRRDPTLSTPASDYFPPHIDTETMYALVLPILSDQHAPEFAPAMQAYLAMPAQDWYSYANRSAVLQEVGDPNRALVESQRALGLAPGEPSVLNNHCYILHSLNRDAEALPFCQRALVAAPDVAAVHHSIATVFAALHRCAEAERALANARRLDPATLTYQSPIACSAS
ncbi:MAG: tetratricopeptide repeat protein [Alphaproteobacteria bacterium]|nr:tetratricopeptide repeat protein [Alphaproteobacteria bacterium]